MRIKHKTYTAYLSFFFLSQTNSHPCTFFINRVKSSEFGRMQKGRMVFVEEKGDPQTSEP